MSYFEYFPPDFIPGSVNDIFCQLVSSLKRWAVWQQSLLFLSFANLAFWMWSQRASICNCIYGCHIWKTRCHHRVQWVYHNKRFRSWASVFLWQASMTAASADPWWARRQLCRLALLALRVLTRPNHNYSDPEGQRTVERDMNPNRNRRTWWRWSTLVNMLVETAPSNYTSIVSRALTLVLATIGAW